MPPNEIVSIEPTGKEHEKSLIEKIRFWTTLLPSVTLIPWVIYKHYTKGPAAKSWTLTEDLTLHFMREMLSRANNVAVEDFQKVTQIEERIKSVNIEQRPFSVPNDYRAKAGDILSRIFTPLENYQIGWDWELDRNQPEVKGEWLQEKSSQSDKTLLYLHGGGYYVACCEAYRPLLSDFIEGSKARTCAINYRSAPQDPFPAGLVDSLATYMYLIDPPSDTIAKIDPKNIVIAGDSAGGGLAMCLLLAIRDGQLPAPAGGITISGFFDVTHSFPSWQENIMSDSLPYLGFKHIPSPALNYDALPKSKAVAPAGAELDTFGDDYGRYQFYAPNKALRIPMVSPVFDRKHLRGLPRVLMQCGQVERLRDESIYAALLATNQYKVDNEKATQVRFEIYIDQPHVCQVMFKNKAATYAKESMVRFFAEVTQQQGQEETLEAYSIHPDGSIRDIKESLLSEMSEEKLDGWTKLLNNPSFKDRVERLKAAYQIELEK
ncbi:alpha/beta-hydrolase [Backusella circina FSU 941]|nr:alpha/beta-hydrolase [Backusella circina FSU 941]